MKYQHYFSVALLFCALYLLYPFWCALWFTVSFADDLIHAATAQSLFDVLGASKTSYDLYLTWGGRYVHHFIVILLGKMTELKYGTFGICASVLVVTVLSLYYFLKSMRKDAPFWPSACLSVVALAVMLTSLPFMAVSELYYWVSGALAGSVGFIAWVVFVGALVRLFLGQGGAGTCALAVGTAFYAIGSYEQWALATVSTASFAFLLAMIHGRQSVHLRVVLCCSILFFLLAFLAPGNFVRAQYEFGHTPHITWAKRLALCSSTLGDTLTLFVKSPLALLGLAMGLFLRRPALVSASPGRDLALSAGYFFGTLAALAFIQTYSPTTSMVPLYWQGRAMGSSMLFVFLSCVFFSAHLFSMIRSPRLSPAWHLAVVPLVLALVAASGTYHLARSNRLAFRSFYETHAEHVRILRQSAGQDVVLDGVVFAWPLFSAFPDFTYSLFGVKSIRVEPSPFALPPP